MKRLIRPIVVTLSALLIVITATPFGWAQTAAPSPAPPSSGEKDAAAGADNLLYVPLKAVGCVLSVPGWVTVMGLSGGIHYNTANDLVRSLCGGKWLVRGEDIHFAESQ